MSNSLTEAENISGNYKWERFPVSLMQSAGVCAERCQIRASAINHPDTKFMIQNYSSQRRPDVISTEHRCTNITFNVRENREVETSEMCWVNNYADCFLLVFILFLTVTGWHNRAGRHGSRFWARCPRLQLSTCQSDVSARVSESVCACQCCVTV